MPRGVMLAGLALLAATALQGQTPDEQARLERLARRYQELEARLSQTAEAGVPRVDSVRVAGIVIFTDSLDSRVFRGALEPFQRQLAEWLGNAVLPLLADARIGVRFGNPDAGWGQLVSGTTQFIGVQQRHRTSEWLTGQLLHRVNALLARRGGSRVAAWGADVRLFQEPEPLLEATYLELLTAGVPSAQGCYDGSLAACARALNLIPGPAEPSPEAAAELRRFVEQRLRHRATEPTLAAPYAACVERGNGEACLTFLERAGVPEPTLSARAAGTLLITVTGLAGSGGLARFFGDTGAAIVPRLEAATALPLGTVLARWRDTVLAHRPAPTAVPGVTQWLVLAWASVLVALATRSSRWR